MATGLPPPHPGAASSLSPRPNLNSQSSLSSLNTAVASDHLGLHHAPKPGADELPSSQPGAVELPPSQTRATELSPSQTGAVDLSPSDPGTNEIPQSYGSASDHIKLHHDLQPRATSSPSQPELLSFLRQILEHATSLFTAWSSRTSSVLAWRRHALPFSAWSRLAPSDKPWSSRSNSIPA